MSNAWKTVTASLIVVAFYFVYLTKIWGVGLASLTSLRLGDPTSLVLLSLVLVLSALYLPKGIKSPVVILTPLVLSEGIDLYLSHDSPLVFLFVLYVVVPLVAVAVAFSTATAVASMTVTFIVALYAGLVAPAEQLKPWAPFLILVPVGVALPTAAGNMPTDDDRDRTLIAWFSASLGLLLVLAGLNTGSLLGLLLYLSAAAFLITGALTWAVNRGRDWPFALAGLITYFVPIILYFTHDVVVNDQSAWASYILYIVGSIALLFYLADLFTKAFDHKLVVFTPFLLILTYVLLESLKPTYYFVALDPWLVTAVAFAREVSAPSAPSNAPQQPNPQAPSMVPQQQALQLNLDALVGREYGIYRIERKLACGGFGCVYEAKTSNKRFAVKVLKVEIGQDPKSYFWELFHEANNLVDLSNHASIVKIYAVNVDLNVIEQALSGNFEPYYRDPPRIVMEFMEGGSLDKYLGDDAFFYSVNWEAIVKKAVRQAAEALAHIHGRGYVHSDVKPHNIFVERRPRDPFELLSVNFKLGDLGSAVRVGTPIAQTTIEYYPPETLTDRARPSMDVFALGITLYVLLTRKNDRPDIQVMNEAFDCYVNNDTNCVKRKVEEAKRLLASWDPQVPEPYKSLVKAMTNPDPAKRPTALEVANMLS